VIVVGECCNFGGRHEGQLERIMKEKGKIGSRESRRNEKIHGSHGINND